ncbi:transcription and mRNA export factor ENY2 [Chrysoperla carnea]|uniref:transcription and mRNA export factor ENY2 n=1 Tax=Chrysoperla carnea TaxID=189513 RepID=UPI001D05C32A|nr:transcription and mRNA export factor ENY2 [Chrysoperla carnea]
MTNKKYDCSKSTNMVLRRANLRDSCRERVKLRLIECGWRDQVKMACRNYLNDPNTKHTFDELVQHVTPKARELVPIAVKKELLTDLQAGLTELADL